MCGPQVLARGATWFGRAESFFGAEGKTVKFFLCHIGPFKRNTRQLLKEMCTIQDLYCMAVVLNSRTRILKLARDVEHGHTHDLIQSELTKVIELDGTGYNPLNEFAITTSNSPSSRKYSSLTRHISRITPITMN